MLLRIAKRVDDFSTICGECQISQSEINGLTRELSLLIQMPNKKSHKSYSKAINNITKHLQKQHKLVTAGQYMGMWGGIGTAIGVVIDIVQAYRLLYVAGKEVANVQDCTIR